MLSDSEKVAELEAEIKYLKRELGNYKEHAPINRHLARDAVVALIVNELGVLEPRDFHVVPEPENHLVYRVEFNLENFYNDLHIRVKDLQGVQPHLAEFEVFRKGLWAAFNGRTSSIKEFYIALLGNGNYEEF